MAWSRPIGLASERVSRPRVPGLIDDGEWAGVPIGGLGSGSIGRSFRGDVSRWHLEVGRHAFRPVAADGFAVFVGRPGRQRGARPLDAPPRRRAAGVGVRPARRAPGRTTRCSRGRGRRSSRRRSAACGSPASSCRRSSPTTTSGARCRSAPYEWRIENASDAPRTVGLLLSWANPLGGRPTESPVAGPCQEAVRDADGVGHRVPRRRQWSGRAPGDIRDRRGGGRRGRPGGTRAVRRPGRPRPVGGLRGRWSADRRRRRRGSSAGARRRVDRRRGRRRPSRSSPARRGRSGSRSRGTCRSPSSAAGGSGGSGTPGRGAARAAGRWTSRATRWRRRRPGGRRSRRGRRPVIEDESLPAWYRAALFNELYFLVDGGTFWEAGEVGGPEPDPDDPGRFALLECLDYPFYDTVDVDFYASAAMVELFPALERRGIRDLLATVAGQDPTPVTIEASGVPGTRKEAFAVPHDVGGPDEDPFVRPNRYRFQDVNGWIDLAPKLALQVVARRRAAGRRRARRGGAAGGRGGAPAPRDPGHATATACPTTAASPTRRTTRGRCTGRRAYGGLLWLGALRAAEELARRDGDGTAADCVGRGLPAGARLVRGTSCGARARTATTPTTAVARSAPTASWRTCSPASGTRTCRGSATSSTRPASRGRCARSTRATSSTSATGCWAP